jgi:GTP-binding protein Era
MIAVAGRPNVGKSTLVNALVGAKVSIVAPKPQTTRHRILGVHTTSAAQLVFIDTPGLHRSDVRAIERYLNRTARGALGDADVIALVVEAARWQDEDEQALAVAASAAAPLVLVMNKIDRLRSRDALLPRIAEVARRHPFAAVVPVSATRRDGLERLEQVLTSLVPEGEPRFEADALTDRSLRFLAAERIREQVVRQLRDELPYATTVEIESYAEEPGLTRIHATIWVEREGQKAIVIGSAGSQIKSIGVAARRELEALCEGRVHLELVVRVREHWSQDQAALERFGYVD